MTSTRTGWTHLHVHSEHSPLDGIIKFKDAVEKVQADGGNAIAVTDHGNMSGAWKFAQIARKAGVKPIIGIEAYLALADDWHDEPDRHAPGTIETERDDETSSDPDEEERGKAQTKATKTKRNQHITLLAKDPAGWRNLVQMVNAATNSYGGKFPLMDFKLIKQHQEGIIALTGCLGGPVLGPVSRGSIPEAEANLERLIDAVGKENVYVEIMEHGIAAESAALPIMHDLAVKYGLPMVATNDAHYTHAEDAEIHEGWTAIQSKSTLDDPKRFRFHGTGYHLRNEQEMRELHPEWDWWQQAITNSGLVADRCDDIVPPAQMRLPAFEIPDNFESSRKYLVHLVQQGIAKLYPGGKYTSEVKERLNTEMKVIADMGFVNYFLIVWDVINWSRENGIRVGPGRGSAAGSLISYCLGIVQIDPLENDLLFERFLEPGRDGMPDIDVDFPQNRRGEVLDYLARKYGANRVARIGSFSAHKTRRALRDAGSLLGLKTIGDKLSKAVPIGGGGQPYSFDKLSDTTDRAADRFRVIVEEYGEDGQRVLSLAAGFADTINGESIHACGTLIADTDLNSLIPLRKDRSKAAQSGMDIVTQWDGKDIEKFGLLKLDVLGLRNLDIVSKAVQFIQETTGETIDPDNLPHPNTKGDPRVTKTWELIRSGRTAGIFQMESAGMARLAQAIEPDCLADLSAIVALYRPGPMSANMHTMYADRKAGTQAVDYSMYSSDPEEQKAIATVLDETYGIFVYQEQLMRLGTVIAGFDATLRSLLRHAIGKKIKAEMESVGKALLEGAPLEHRDEATGELISRAFRVETAERMFDYMKGSAEYLFNKSHSAAYAQLAFITAYLKANWPAQYGAAILAETDKDDKRLLALRALREDNITVKQPHINNSRGETYPTADNEITLGLGEIKGVGQAGHLIAKNREQYGPFRSVHHLMTRAIAEDGKAIADVGTVEGLIEAGALDEFGKRLGLLRVAKASKAHEIAIPGDDWGVLERARRQRFRLGMIMGEHPLENEEVLKEITEWRTPPSREEKKAAPADEPVLNAADEDRMPEPTGKPAFQPKGKNGRPPTALSTLPEEDRHNFLIYGLLAEWAERPYSKGQMANFTVESPAQSVRGVMWDESLRALREEPEGVPQTGKIIAVSGQVQVNRNEVRDEEDNVIEIVTTKDIMASRIWPIPVSDVPTSPAEDGADTLRWLDNLPMNDELIEAAREATRAASAAAEAAAALVADGGNPEAGPESEPMPEERTVPAPPKVSHGHLPVIVYDNRSSRPCLWGSGDPLYAAFLDDLGALSPSAFIDTDTPLVSVVSKDRQPRYIVVSLPKRCTSFVQTGNLPTSLPADNLPTWWQAIGLLADPTAPDASMEDSPAPEAPEDLARPEAVEPELTQNELRIFEPPADDGCAVADALDLEQIDFDLDFG